MTWYAWAFLFFLLLAWLLLFYQCLRFLGCCAGPRTHKGVRRDSDGRLLACIFCHIAQQQGGATPPSPASPSASSPPSSPPPFPLIPDPSLPLPLPPPTHLTPTPILYSTPWVVVFSPRTPAASRHLLVVPKAHIDDCHRLVEGVRDPTPGEGGEEGEEEEREWGDGVKVEEEKELTPLQYLDHMLEVGRFVLSHPHLMSDPAGGVPLPRRQRGGRLLSLLCCHRGRHVGVGSSTPAVSPAGMNGHGGVGMNGTGGVRRRWGASPVMPVGSEVGGARKEGVERREVTEEVDAPVSYRFCFHAPPHNSIAHIHLHCFQLPFTSKWSQWSFRPHTRRCKEASDVREDIVRRDQSQAPQQGL